MTEFVIIVAHDPNLVIGKDGTLPWRIPEDLKHFKETTLGHPLLMGRGVFEELGEKPLPGRENFVLTARDYPQVTTFTSIPEAIRFFKEKETETVFIIGGGKIYAQMMDIADKMIVTLVKESYDGDTFFPEYRTNIGTVWKETSRTDFERFTLIEYTRIKR
jgi:dihydrofolate reductase